MSIALRGWGINLTGSSITIYDGDKNWVQQGSKVGTLTANECCAEGTAFGAGWEGWGTPIYFRNSAGVFTLGAIQDSSRLTSFSNYASNGSSWVSVSTLQRNVNKTTYAYYADGTGRKELPPGSLVWLTSNCTRGQNNPNYVAVTAVQPKGGNKLTYSGNGFVDLVNGNWLNVSSILLRKS